MHVPYSVLIIDDEVRFCSSLTLLLQAEGYTVHAVHTGMNALRAIEQQEYSVALVDLLLPDMHGNHIAARINEDYPQTAVIILTGNATVDNAVESLRQGVYDYLRKPCPPDQLLQTLARTIKHKQLQQELYKSEKRFRQLAQATWEGILIYDQGELLQTNDQLCRMFGYQAQELLGKQIFEVLLDRHSVRTMQHYPAPEAIGPFEARGVKKNGATFPVEIRVKHIDYKGRKVQVAAIRDVSDREIAMQQKMELLEKLADARRMESLGLMTSSVAHDLNNIMAGIVTYPELILMHLDSKFEYHEELLMIREAGKRASSVINDLLLVARGTTSAKVKQNINELISTYLNSLEYRELTQQYPAITIHSYLDAKLEPINCSTLHINKVIANLMLNATEAIHHSGTITLRTKNVQLTEPFHGYEQIAAGEYVLFSVADSGTELSPDHLQHLFSPFYSRKIMGRSGTGLGLAVVWSTVHEHEGYLDVTTSELGTIFSLYFPTTRFQGLQYQSSQYVETLYRGNGETILVVDDQINHREVASRLLAHLGYRPIMAESGEAAIQYVQNHPVDVLLLDMVMDPGISGGETYRRILELYPAQKAILTSGFSHSEEIAQAMDLGISHFIKKPYSLYEMALVLKTELRASSPTALISPGSQPSLL